MELNCCRGHLMRVPGRFLVKQPLALIRVFLSGAIGLPCSSMQDTQSLLKCNFRDSMIFLSRSASIAVFVIVWTASTAYVSRGAGPFPPGVVHGAPPKSGCGPGMLLIAVGTSLGSSWRGGR